ncbi:hypothetical protein B0J15DRAFT_491087 [Fusarium solani]|uniref:Uncharacterized protein n=1 Tax=Fusarium solani TaxID=169388 RepID=A0A9P9HV31_FUSSL|nr:uncharacterized protein B0J15DRAFT_491087 [Fusarium solani]KAH7264573.1 hypothetical protein B0J15DRAFT_491087 [Fusarium solani]
MKRLGVKSLSILRASLDVTGLVPPAWTSSTTCEMALLCFPSSSFFTGIPRSGAYTQTLPSDPIAWLTGSKMISDLAHTCLSQSSVSGSRM